MTNAGKLFQIFSQGFGNRAFFLQAQNLVQTNKEQMQFVLSINKVQESVEELPLTTKKLSEVKTCDIFLVEKLKKAKELGKEKNFPLNIFQ